MVTAKKSFAPKRSLKEDRKEENFNWAGDKRSALIDESYSGFYQDRDNLISCEKASK